MFELFKIMGTIGVDNSEANSALEETDSQAGETSKSIGQKMQDGLGKAQKAIGNVGTNMTKWVTGPVVAAGAGIFGLMTSTGNYADRLLDLSDITGMSTDSLQEWGYVADIAGVDGEAVAQASRRMTQRLDTLTDSTDDNAQMFGEMGLSHQAWIDLDQEDKMDSVIYALADMEDETRRNEIANEMFGRGWQDLAPILGMGSDELDGLRDKAHDLGVVMDGESLDAANEFRQNMEELKNEFAGVFRELSNKLLPIFTDQLLPIIQENIIPAIVDFVDRIAEVIEWFTNLDPSIQGAIGKFIALMVALGPILMVVTKIIGGIKLLIPVFVALFSPIGLVIAAIAGLIAIGVALYQNWDVIKEKASELGERLSEIWSNIKEWTSETWNNVKTSVSEGITGAWNSVTEKAGAIKDNLAQRFSEADKSAALSFSNIGHSISSKMSESDSSVIRSAGSILGNITSNFDEAYSETGNTFSAIQMAISNSLSDAASAAKNKAGEIASNIGDGISDAYNTVTDFFGRFKDAGRNIVTSIADGITDAISTVTDAIDGVVSKVRDFLPFSPAKEGPLKDLDKLDFGGTISHSIEADEKKVQQAMRHLLEMPDMNRGIVLNPTSTSKSSAEKQLIELVRLIKELLKQIDGGQEINITNNNHSPDPLSAYEIERQQRLSLQRLAHLLG